MPTAADLIYRTKVDDKGLKQGLNKSKKTVDKASNQQVKSLNKVNTAAGKTGVSVSALQDKLVGAFSGAVVLGGVTAYTKSLLSLGSTLEDTRIQFTNFLKSKDLANEFIDVLNEFANVTPYANEQVLKSGRILLAFSKELREDSDLLKETLTNIGNAAAFAGKPIDEFCLLYTSPSPRDS